MNDSAWQCRMTVPPSPSATADAHSPATPPSTSSTIAASIQALTPVSSSAAGPRAAAAARLRFEMMYDVRMTTYPQSSSRPCAGGVRLG